jgi:hypothetical protein
MATHFGPAGASPDHGLMMFHTVSAKKPPMPRLGPYIPTEHPGSGAKQPERGGGKLGPTLPPAIRPGDRGDPRSPNGALEPTHPPGTIQNNKKAPKSPTGPAIRRGLSEPTQWGGPVTLPLPNPPGVKKVSLKA